MGAPHRPALREMKAGASLPRPLQRHHGTEDLSSCCSPAILREPRLPSLAWTHGAKLFAGGGGMVEVANEEGAESGHLWYEGPTHPLSHTMDTCGWTTEVVLPWSRGAAG